MKTRTHTTAILAASLSTALCATLTPSEVAAQVQVYEWAGGVSQDWQTAGNWVIVEDPIGTPTSDPAGVAPTPDTIVEIATTTGSPIISSGAQVAGAVRVGGTSPGRLDITGGSLEIEAASFDNNTPGAPDADDFEIGADNTATVSINDLNGPAGIVIGDDLNVDREAASDYNSTVVISGDVTIEVNDRMELGSGSSSNLFFDFQGGVLRAGDDIRVRGGSSAEMRVSGGLVEGADELDVDSLLAISGNGVVRVDELTSVSAFQGVVTIDDQGLLQISDSETPLSQILDYIDTGVFSTSGPGLIVSTVSIPDFFGSAREFYQVSVIPEPATGLMLLTMLSAGLGARKRATR